MATDTVLTLFVIVAALAIVMQALILFGIWRAVSGIPAQMEEVHQFLQFLKERVEPLTESMTEIVNNSRAPLETFSTSLTEIGQTLRQRSTQVDAVVEDLVEKSRVQIGRVDQMVSDLIEKVESTSDKVQQGVLAPIQEIAAIMKGIQAGLEFLFSRRRPAGSPPGSHEPTQEEQQLFI